MDLLHLPDAVRELGISYPTLKQWIYKGKIRAVKTAGGHHRIPRSEIDRLLFQKGTKEPAVAKAASRVGKVRPPKPGMAAGLEHFISGRNQLVGRIIKLEIVGLLAKVVLDVGGQTVTSVITREAAHDLGLKVGVTAAALIKATEVMIIRPFPQRS
jgi:molybdopterin-binding protein